MKQQLITIILVSTLCYASAQSNFVLTNPAVAGILKGDYDPSVYSDTNQTIANKDIFLAIDEQISPANLETLLIDLEAFGTRHTSSDTLSDTRGMGAARSYVHKLLEGYNSERLLPFYFQFDQNICGVSRHKNVCAVLHGTQTNDNSIIIVEAHLDSRCENNCDVDCPAPGAEDNASGTALVIELARVMSQYNYDRTIVFMLTTGEEQGLIGATAFATYCQEQGIAIKAVFNNDTVGGIVCGETSSPPSCPFEGAIDSTSIKLFSGGGKNKQLCRWIKLEYMDELIHQVQVPMMISLMAPLDRTGRGGDHIPFTQMGYTAMRFTSAHENGNGNVTDPDYDDHQHSTRDVLGYDTNGDGILDSLFLDFNYLARNTVINGAAITAAALGPATPTFSFIENGDSIDWTVEDPLALNHYRIASRTDQLDFDTIYTFEGVDSGSFPRYAASSIAEEYISGAGVDIDDIESFFGPESIFLAVSSTKETTASGGKFLLQNIPNPFSGSTLIQYMLSNLSGVSEVELLITDLVGRQVETITAMKNLGINSFNYYAQDNMSGVYYYSLVIDGRIVDSKRMLLMP